MHWASHAKGAAVASSSTRPLRWEPGGSAIGPHRSPWSVEGVSPSPAKHVRRKLGDGVLYRVLRAHFPALQGRLDVQGLPEFVPREFEEYPRCGIAAEGCWFQPSLPKIRATRRWARQAFSTVRRAL